MGISSALYSGVSGLTINGVAMNVLGDNLANTNTVGHKSSRSVFSDILSSKISGSGGMSQVGRGVNMSTVDQVFSQGSFDTTESNLDCAIEGESFFVLNDPSDSDREDYYSRAGAFRFNVDGFLENPEGLRVQGKPFDENGNLLPGDATDIQLVDRGLVAGKISDEVTLNTNLDSRAKVTGPAAIAPADPSTYNYASAVEIFDSLGVPHLLTLYFQKQPPNATGQSEWKAFWSAKDENDNPLGAPVNEFPTPLAFDTKGHLTPGSAAPMIIDKGDLLWKNGSDAKDVAVTFATTQYSSDSTVLAVDQNGYGAGSLTNVEVDKEGRIIANYSNGRQRRVAQLSLAKFVNPHGLEQKGANVYRATQESGAPRKGVSDKELGKIFTNSLERSNVDMGNEMVQIITTQRGYSANSKVITTVDEMMQEVINLKR